MKSDHSQDPASDQPYDGIELDHHPTPVWCKWLFMAMLPFAPVYFMYYHGGAEGRTLGDQHDLQLATVMQARYGELGDMKMDRQSVVKFLYEDSWLQVGKLVFRKNCASCHAKDGGGLIGPNLCDDQYKNVTDIADLLQVLQNGANAGAMPGWKERLPPTEIVLVASYVASLRGSTPANAKASEGRTIAPWPQAPPQEKTGASATAPAPEKP